MLTIILLAGCGGSGGGSSAPAPTLVSISVTPINPIIALSTMQQFTATGTFSDNTTHNLTESVTWSSTSALVATISNTAGSNGLATSVGTGSTTITAASGGILGSTTLTITGATIVSISVTPTNPSIVLGTTQQFTATGTFSDNTTQNVTGSVLWSSASTSVATISNTAGSNGLATSVSTGATTITATSENVPGTTTLTVISETAPVINVMPITVNGSLCSASTSAGYINKPCVSVTICTPGSTTACQTINDILLDTGSYGLRIFKQVLTVPLQTIASGSGSLTNCALFADGSSDWGPVELAGVVLGNEPAINVPIQVIDATFGNPASCGTPDQSPADAGFSGILGVGLFGQDCGPICVSSNAVGIYYTCSGTVCNPTTVPLANQVSNPVVSLPTDNNGVIVQLPTVPSSGSLSVNGNLVLGIDTRTNNASSGATMFSVDDVNSTSQNYGEILTIFNGVSYGGVIDSGSNGLFFTAPSSQIPLCGDNPSWFCPASTITLSAENTGYLGTPINNVSFQIGNFDSLINSSNKVFSNIGGPVPPSANFFDWGLPFYFGQSIYVGIEGQESKLGTGPYYAY